jgi:NAD(P)-dependent dehydrogenase (short-subunit alcohol dehydrogenase family)
MGNYYCRKVNNAGVLSSDLTMVLETNFYGVKKVCDAFARDIVGGGRIVNISSGAAPMFLQRCSPEIVQRMTSPDIELEDIEEIIGQFKELCDEGGMEACAAAG